MVSYWVLQKERSHEGHSFFDIWTRELLKLRERAFLNKLLKSYPHKVHCIFFHSLKIWVDMDRAEISQKRCFSFSHVLFQAPPFFSFGGRRKKSNVAWLHQKITQKAKRKRGNKATANLPGLSFFFFGGGGRGNLLRRGACFQILTQKVINLLPILSSHLSSFKKTIYFQVAASLLH